jgi:uncharacterized RDD family membrane protein YckC
MPDIYAGFWPRLGGYLLDGLIVGVVNALIQAATSQVAGIVISLVISAGYSLYFLGSTSGQTIGMRAAGIRLVDAKNYGRIDYTRCLTRYLVAIASGLVCLLGYFWMLWDPQKQTWHDKVAGTIVVSTNDFPVDAWPG